MFIEKILNPVLEQIRVNGEAPAFCINSRFYSYATFGQHISRLRKAVRDMQPATGRIGLGTNDAPEPSQSI